MQWVSRISLINAMFAHTTGATLAQDSFQNLMIEPGICEHPYIEILTQDRKLGRSSRRCPLVVAIKAEAKLMQRVAHRALNPAGCTRANPLVKARNLHSKFVQAACELINATSHRYEIVAATAATRFHNSVVPLCTELSCAAVPRLLQRSCLFAGASGSPFLLSAEDVESDISKICTV
jgi:hypothetical protein